MFDKNVMRKAVLEKRESLSPHMLEIAGVEVAEKLVQSEEYLNSNTIMLYMDFRNEIPTKEIIKIVRSSNKELVLPLTTTDYRIKAYEIPKKGALSGYLSISRHGILEPDPSICKEADLSTIDLVVVPGSVFDQHNNRIGYGKGCYDKFLVALSDQVFKLAFAYDFQVLPYIPVGTADVKMDKIITIITK